MAQTDPLSRRHRHHEEIPEDTASLAQSRAERTRARREQSMERRFTGVFIIAVAATLVYLVIKTPWGLSLVHHLHP